MLSPLFAFIFRSLGWKTLGPPPYSIPKAIWLGAPHNSNWDFIMSVGARAQIKFDVGFLAKKELFRWYSGWIFKALGGFPLDRSKAQNQVEAVANTFQQHERMHVAIAPEGTRSDVAKLKTGFYYIALKANIPLILTGFDYPRKAFVISDPIYLTGNFQKDMKLIYDFYLTIQGPKKTWLKEYAKTGQIPVPSKN